MTIPRDKIYHAIAGAVLGSGVFYVTGSAAWGIGAAAAAGIVKELYDMRGNGTVEALDAAATCAGGIAAVALLRLLL